MEEIAGAALEAAFCQKSPPRRAPVSAALAWFLTSTLIKDVTQWCEAVDPCKILPPFQPVILSTCDMSFPLMKAPFESRSTHEV